MTPALAARIDGADCLFFDGTLWRDDEMIRAGAGPKTGARMGHMSIDGRRARSPPWRACGSAAASSSI